jgi:dihydrofolate reductase
MGGIMGSVLVDISVSVDGFITGPNVNAQLPLGKDGERLHEWFFAPQAEIEKTAMAELAQSSGAIILGRNMYDTGIDTGWGGVSPFKVPAYVLTSRPAPEKRVEGFHFLQDGIEKGLTQAKATAGQKDVWVIGGANVIQQYLKAGLVDELRLHIIPIVFGEGTRLLEHLGTETIELEKISVMDSPGAIHTRFRILK